jgi:PAS domain S-box-containing protein
MSRDGSSIAGPAMPWAPGRLAETSSLDQYLVSSLDRLAHLAGRLLAAPAAWISVNGEEASRYASAGGPVDHGADGRAPTASELCCRRVAVDGVALMVPDVRADERLNVESGSIEYDVAAYLGCPLRSPTGEVLGSFSVTDVIVREWTRRDLAVLADLSTAAGCQIALQAAFNQLLRSSTHIRSVLDGAHDAFVSMDADGRVTGWNTAAERLFGWSATEAVGRPATELMIPPRFHTAHQEGMQRVRRTGRSVMSGRRLPLTAVDRSGREFPIEMTLQVSAEQEEVTFHAFLHDISDRVAAQTQLERERQQLADERAFLQALLDSLDTGVAACDSEGRPVLLNEAMKRLYPGEPSVADLGAGTDSVRLYAADGRTALLPDRTPLARAFTGEVVHGEHVVVQGQVIEPRRLLANARPIQTADGRRLGAVVAMHDITDTHRAELLRRCQHAVAQALSEARSACQAAAAAAAAVAAELGWVCAEYWEVDEDRQHIVRASSWTAAGAELSDFTGPEPLSYVSGQGLPGTIWARGHPVWARRISDSPVDSNRRRIAERLGLATGIGVPVRCERQVLGVLVFFTDVELARDDDVLAMLDGICLQVGRYLDRRRTDDLTLALSAARRDLHRIVQQVNDCSWTVEVLPTGHVRSIYSSPHPTGVFGGDLPTDADMAQALAERMHPDDKAAFHQFHLAVSAGEPAQFECRVIGYDGITRWVWTRAVTRREGARLFADGLSTNITERRELADQREHLLAQQRDQVRRLHELDRMKDELVAVVSHELRNPIAIIRGYTELLLTDPELAPPHRDDIANIDRTGAHLQHLVDDLLDLARLEADPTAINSQPLDLGPLIHDITQTYQRAATTHHVTLTTDVNVTEAVTGDAVRLRQVLDNLLSNAIKYTPDGGKVTVAANSSAAGITIAVTDTGIGVPADQYPKLFTRFFRASTAISRGIKGTGLGLAVTKSIVEAHHGTINAQPGPDGGTSITVTLPTKTALDPPGRTRHG